MGGDGVGEAFFSRSGEWRVGVVTVYIVAGNGDSARAIAICETTVFSAADGCALFGGAAHSGFIHSFSGEGISDVVGFF